MFDSSTLFSLMAASVGLALLPGPSSMLVLSRSISHGRATALATCMGNFVGSVIVVLATAIGLAKLLQVSVLAFTAVKLGGAGYLVYLGIRMGLGPATARADTVTKLPITLRQAFVQGVFTDLLNPKSVLFFSAFLPQFIHLEQGSTLIQFVLLGLVTSIILIAWVVVLAFGGSAMGRWLNKNPVFLLWQSRIAGLALMALGLRLAFARRE